MLCITVTSVAFTRWCYNRERKCAGKDGVDNVVETGRGEIIYPEMSQDMYRSTGSVVQVISVKGKAHAIGSFEYSPQRVLIALGQVAQVHWQSV